MSDLELTQQRTAERDALLKRIVAILAADERVVAAWLYGSLGRGTEDVWSDIDLWVVVRDEHIETISNERHEYASVLGKPLVMVDAPQNAPANGAFLSVLYRGGIVGPQHVDWTWQAQSEARVPGDAKVLFKRVEIPEQPSKAPQSLAERAGSVANELAFFWMMLPIVAKSVVRGQPWKALNLLAFVRYTLDKVCWLIGAIDEPPEYPTSSPTLPPVQPVDQLIYLRELAREAEGLFESRRKEGDSVPADARLQVYDLLDLALHMVRVDQESTEHGLGV